VRDAGQVHAGRLRCHLLGKGIRQQFRAVYSVMQYALRGHG
jgi:hypothetical protein